MSPTLNSSIGLLLTLFIATSVSLAKQPQQQ
jgi:hypothetical protein